MKKNLTFILSLLMLTGCKQSSENLSEVLDRQNIPIEINAKVNELVLTRAENDGVEESIGFTANQHNAFEVISIERNKEVEDAADDPIYFNPTPVDVNSDLSFSFTETRYYPSNSTKELDFYGFAPVVSGDNINLSDKSVLFNIDGSQDIIWAKDDTGHSKASVGEVQSNPQLDFNHKLMRLKFSIKRTPDFAETNITNITLVRVKNAASLNMLNGSLTWDAESTTNFTAFTGEQNILLTHSNVNASMYIEPQDAITLSITAGGITYPNYVVNFADTEADSRAGESQMIDIVFSPTQIEIAATVTPWREGGRTTATIQ